MKLARSFAPSLYLTIHCELRMEPPENHSSKETIAFNDIESACTGDTVHDLPSFGVFAKKWYSENEIRWKHSYKQTLRSSLDKHVLPVFGDQCLAGITRSDILEFRSNLAKRPGRNPTAGLSPARINTIMVPLRLIMTEAADQLDFDSPYTKIKALKVPRTSVSPFTLEEVKLILKEVRKDYQPYFTVRFFTGMRTGEIHGLKWKCVDFRQREIQVRESFVAGALTDTKTDSSFRDIPMSNAVYTALQDQKQTSGGSEFVFSTCVGNPLGVQNVSNRVWKPLLESLGLPYRRLYQTRHTAAALWLASGENVLWVSQQLGHSDPNTTLRKYAKYAPNLTRRDGSAFAAVLDAG
ncbi:MAG: tyrosine-type recombinase/integrase [Proteobacteria bacterium]|nr:tyrosine-type recombinase/integrase [Pseudomonadota bacterium]MDA1350661.1 tyrosine-type recombinase/integrase [Pseudomonadota bacterium]